MIYLFYVAVCSIHAFLSSATGDGPQEPASCTGDKSFWQASRCYLCRYSDTLIWGNCSSYWDTSALDRNLLWFVEFCSVLSQFASVVPSWWTEAHHCSKIPNCAVQ